MIRAIICRPGEPATIETIESIQRIVGGRVEKDLTKIADNIVVYYDADAESDGALPCRAILHDDEHAFHVRCGTIVIAYDRDWPFPVELLRKFDWPHQFFLTDKGIEVCRFERGLIDKEHLVMDERTLI